MHNSAKAILPIGRVGLVNISNYSKVPIEGAIQMEGLEVIDGSVHREPGNVVYNATPIADTQFVNVIEYYPTPSVKRLVAAVWHTTAPVEGRFLKDDGTGAFATTLKTGVVYGAGTHFVVGGAETAGRNKKLFIFSGTTPVQVLSGDGATTTDLTTPPADWATTNQPFFGALHRNCLWGGGNPNDPHRIYKSSPTDHEDFTTSAFSISVFPGEGDSLCGARSYNGRLFLFKRPTGIYWLDDSSNNTADWGIKRLVNTVGLVNPNGICETEEDLTFISHELNLYTLSTVQEFGDVKPRNMLEEFNVDKWLTDRINPSGGWAGSFFTPKLIWHPRRRNLILSAARVGGGYLRLCIDYRDAPKKITYSFRDPHEASAIIHDANGVLQHVYGFQSTLYRGDQASKFASTVSNGPWISRYQIPHTDFSYIDTDLIGLRKRLRWLSIESSTRDPQTIYADVYLDDVYRYTLTFPFSALGGFIIGSSKLGVGRLGGFAIHTISRRLRGSCERVSVIFYTSDPSAEMNLGDVTIRFKRSKIRQRRRI